MVMVIIIRRVCRGHCNLEALAVVVVGARVDDGIITGGSELQAIRRREWVLWLLVVVEPLLELLLEPLLMLVVRVLELRSEIEEWGRLKMVEGVPVVDAQLLRMGVEVERRLWLRLLQLLVLVLLCLVWWLLQLRWRK